MGKKFVKVNDSMQKGYRYQLVAAPGKNFHPDFRPELTPKQMLDLGVFGGGVHARLQKRISIRLV